MLRAPRSRERRFDRQADGAHGHGPDDSSAPRARQSPADPEPDRPRPSIDPHLRRVFARRRECLLHRRRTRTWSVPRVVARCPSPCRRNAVGYDLRGRAADRARRRARGARRGRPRLAAGASGVVVLEAPAGLGKTALLDDAAPLAAAAGCLVRRAAPGPLERHFPFGVVRALLEAPLREASAERARAAARRRRGAGRRRCCWRARRRPATRRC